MGQVAGFQGALFVGSRRLSKPLDFRPKIAVANFLISGAPIPFSITIEEAAAPHSSLAFMLWGEGLFVFPLMLLYTVISYSVFRGKVRPTTDHY